MPSYPPRDMSESERRRRAAARARRKRQVARNRLIFCAVCLALIAAVGFGAFKLAGVLADGKENSGASGQSTSQTTSSSGSASTSSSEPASEPAGEPASSGETVTPATDGDWRLTLVNNNVALPEDWQITTKVAEASTQKELADEAADAYMQMKQAAAMDGVELLLCSGYRTVEYQQNLFDQEKQKWLDQGMSEEEAYDKAKTVVAVPGYSEHNSGLAADIVTPDHQTLDSAFANTDAAKWLFEHAPEYGFILRYPEDKQAITGIIYEPWHYRYVGVENAKAITESGKCLEEYLDGLSA